MKIKLIALSAVTVLAVGCGGPAVWDYAQESGSIPVVSTAYQNKTVAVRPFIDKRTFETGGSFALGLIPLMPVAIAHSDQPDNDASFVTIDAYKFDPCNDLANAAMQNLKRSNIFADVKLTPTRGNVDADYIFQGTVTRTHYEGGYLPYCITYFGAPVLWILGCPMAYSSNELAVEFELIDT